MPQKYTVPQFIDIEDKILGPLTVRQFLIMLTTILLMALTYQLADFDLFVIMGLMEFALGSILAFLRINGMPFHFFMLNFLQTARKPRLRVWNKELATKELEMLRTQAPPPPAAPKQRKEALSTSRLSELSLIVNTGGAYRPDEQ